MIRAQVTWLALGGGESGSRVLPKGLQLQCKSGAHGQLLHCLTLGCGHCWPSRVGCCVTTGRCTMYPPLQFWEHALHAVHPLKMQSFVVQSSVHFRVSCTHVL